MSHLRDIVDRTVSGFFYGSSHAPECAVKKIVVRTSGIGFTSHSYFRFMVPVEANVGHAMPQSSRLSPCSQSDGIVPLTTFRRVLGGDLTSPVYSRRLGGLNV